MFKKIFAAALFLTLCASTCFAGSQYVDWIRQQSFKKCPKYYMGVLIDNFLENARWEGGETADGEIIVNVRGVMLFKDKPAKTVMQFTINSHNRSWSMTALQINGQLYDQTVRAALVEKICER